jgi:protease I
MDAMGKPIGSICHGPWLLSSARILKGRTITCFHAIKDDMEFAGATYVEGKEVVVDGNLVTSRIPSDLPAFCRALIDLMKSRV